MNGPPEPIASDYVELVTLVLLFIVGAPVNLAAYTQISERPAATRLDILKRHLNYSDLLVLFIYVPSRACWLITYDWRGGDFLCRAVKFMHTFAFQVSSNVIVVIAMDRLLTVISSAHHNPQRAHKRMRRMLGVAWFTALMISAPQFAIWRTFLAFEDIHWAQCMQIWEIARAEAFLHQHNVTTVNANQLVREENIYMVLHMLLIFWIPAMMILLCYVVVSCWVYFNSKPTPLSTQHFSSTYCLSAVHTAAECTERSLAANKRRRLAGGVRINGAVEKDAAAVHYDMRPRIMINDESLSLIHGGAAKANAANGCDPSPPPSILVRQGSSTPSSSGAALCQVCVTPITTGGGSASITSAMRNSQSSSYSTGKAHAANRTGRAIRVSFLLVAAYIVCWLPYNALSLIQFIDPELFHKHANKVYCLHGMIVFNSVINPYLYGLFGGLCKPRTQ